MGGYGWPKVIHTLEIDVMAAAARSNNNGVDVERVDNWLGCVPRLKISGIVT
jgi:hypothetical protein